MIIPYNMLLFVVGIEMFMSRVKFESSLNKILGSFDKLGSKW